MCASNGFSRRRTHTADVAELVDALDLGSSIERCESSSLSVRTSIPLSESIFLHSMSRLLERPNLL